LLELKDAAWQFIQTHSYLGIFILILVEESGVPLLFLPGEIVVAWAGFQYSSGNMDLLTLVFTTVAAVAIGSSFLYGVSYRVGPRILITLARVVHLDSEKAAKAEGWVRRRGVVAVVLGRLIPGLRTPTSIVSGVSHIPYRNFVPATLFAAVLWTLGYVYAGVVLGSAWDQLDDRLYGYLLAHRLVATTIAGVVLVSALVAVCGIVLTRFKGPWRRQPA